MSVKWEEPAVPQPPASQLTSERPTPQPPPQPMLDLGWLRARGYRDGYLRGFDGTGGQPLWPPLPVSGPIQSAYRKAFRSGYQAGTADRAACGEQ